ncbi:hypothetical protein Q8791_23065 [Nocardiopsis sp. CT-R113]|uniref:Uncharacterized protein n=1 Tax=Nocardiopsis codii TaxID=3065942 RepID=A0ABU7KDJ4_9ACTN|nr:hypothetical protein [Nocardiopsis sp. CT-R113]MEE2040102.1 hypothetical protein [Nocardiopsis sp. CT-R113]
MPQTADSLQDISHAVAAAIDAEAADEACHWAQDGLHRQGFNAAVIPLPEAAPSTDAAMDHAQFDKGTWPYTGTFYANPTPAGIEVWQFGDLPDEDHPRLIIPWDDAVGLLPQLARLVQDHKAEQAATREKKIAEYAARMHADPNVCPLFDAELCEFCKRAATYAVDNPPA